VISFILHQHKFKYCCWPIFQRSGKNFNDSCYLGAFKDFCDIDFKYNKDEILHKIDKMDLVN